MHSIELLESRIAPASLTGRVLSYTDVDGDKVTVTFSKGSLAADNFVFDTAFGSTGTQQLQRIDLIDETDIEGCNITVKVAKAATGDGVAHIGEIIATGRDLGIVKTKGDLGKFVAGDNSMPAPAIKALTIGSYGLLDGTTQPAGSNQSSSIAGDVPKFTILGDMSGGAISVNGDLGILKIGGSIIGGRFSAEGRFIVSNGDVEKVIIGGSIIGGSDSLTGSLTFGGNVGTLKVLGSIFGGSAVLDVVSSQVLISGSVGKFFVRNDITGATGDGENTTITVGGTVESFTVGGNIIAPNGKEASINLANEVDVPGIAVGSIVVGGTVENAVIGVGANPNRPVTLDRLTIGGAFIKSRIVVGTSAGEDLFAGNEDDVINAASRLNTLIIKGTVFGTVGGMDSYFIEAGRIVSVTLAGRNIPTTPGGNMITASTSGDVFLRDLV